jgi:hypothetical protein
VRWTGALSFGYLPVTRTHTVTRTLTLTNLHTAAVNVELAAYFRYGNDEKQGVAITIEPSSLLIAANSKQEVAVVLKLYPAGIANELGPLKPWLIDKGEQGNDGELSSDQEVDGFVVITPSVGTTIQVHLCRRRCLVPGICLYLVGQALSCRPISGGV